MTSCKKKYSVSTRESGQQIYKLVTQVKNDQNQAIDQWLDSVPLEERIAQVFLVNIVGNSSFVPVEYVGDMIGKPHTGKPLIPGGCILFSYNIADTPSAIMDFTDSIHMYCVDHDVIPPFISTDQEGGVVNRLRGINGPLPSNKRVAERLAESDAYFLYMLQARQMKALGFHLNLAPVAESISDINKDFLGDRSFGDSDTTMRYTVAAVKAYELIGIGSVLKHFPGNTNMDPHTGLPEIMWSPKQIQDIVIKPFSYFVSQSPSGILMSHARTSAYDSDTPACLSSYWVQEILRQKMGYTGIIFSDDIFMDALQKNGFTPEKAVMLAVSAGVDCIMLSEKRFASVAKIVLDTYTKDQEFATHIDESIRRIISWKIDKGILSLQKTEAGDWIVVPGEITDRKERLAVFSDAYNKNIALYRTYFMD
ncbi:MAG: glycoside hydrolase family 3 protein [Treponema sp.]|nr:glycoside hydrolase family 3 protein [Treponema sp.]